MHRGGGGSGNQVSIVDVRRIRIASLERKGRIGIDEARGTTVDGADGGPPRECLHDRTRLRGCVQDILLVGNGEGCAVSVIRSIAKTTAHASRHRKLLGDGLQLTKSLIANEEECLVLLDGPADGQSVLTHAERRDGWIAIDVEVIEIASVENGISYIAKCRPVEVIRARLRNDVDLATGLGAIFSVV